MNIATIMGLADKFGIQINYQAIGAVVSIWNKKAVELDSSDVRKLVGLVSPNADDQLINDLTLTLQTSDGDTLANYLSDENRVRRFASRIILSDERLVERLETTKPFINVKCPKCGYEDKISRKSARLDAQLDGTVTINCIECDSHREVPYRNLMLHDL